MLTKRETARNLAEYKGHETKRLITTAKRLTTRRKNAPHAVGEAAVFLAEVDVYLAAREAARWARKAGE